MPINALRPSAIAAAVLLLAGGTAWAANAGPEPYKAADPHYAEPMQQEPLVSETKTKDTASLGSTDDIKGPAAGPEPYSAPTPQYTPVSSEPKFEKTTTPPPKL